jgi:hypothetical protein
MPQILGLSIRLDADASESGNRGQCSRDDSHAEWPQPDREVAIVQSRNQRARQCRLGWRPNVQPCCCWSIVRAMETPLVTRTITGPLVPR